MIIKFTEKRPNGVPEKFLNVGFYKAEAVGTLMNKSIIPSGFFSYTTSLSCFFFFKFNSVNSYSTDCIFNIVTADSKVVYSWKSWKPYKPIY